LGHGRAGVLASYPWSPRDAGRRATPGGEGGASPAGPGSRAKRRHELDRRRCRVPVWLRALARAEELGSVRAARRHLSIHPSTFYRWRTEARGFGLEGSGSYRSERAPTVVLDCQRCGRPVLWGSRDGCGTPGKDLRRDRYGGSRRAYAATVIGGVPELGPRAVRLARMADWLQIGGLVATPDLGIDANRTLT